MGKKIRIRRKSPTAVFSGSLIQQNFGESIDKGYVLWNTDDNTHERRYILNDCGFAKIDIAKGEDVEERIDFIKFSNNKRKTKVYITWEDYEENFSIEKENQIKRLVKDKHGCESVRVEFKEIRRDITDIKEEDSQTYLFEESFKDWIKEGKFNLEKDFLEELIEFSRHVDETLEIDESKYNIIDDWDINSIEISNILSFDKKPIRINFDKITGITGIFGKNFNGKSNVVKAIVWGLYKEILGSTQGDSKYLVNIYTDSNSGYVIENLTINGEKYRVTRKITTNNGKNVFNTKYEKLVNEYDEDGVLVSEKWVDKVSDKKTSEQKEVQQLVKDAIGIFDDFTKTSLQAQGGAGDYLSQQPQPKNNLISRFLGLETYKERHDYAKSFFNDVKRKQKDLGNVVEIEDKIKETNLQIKSKTDEMDSIKKEKDSSLIKQNNVNDDIISLTKQLEKVEDSGITDKILTEEKIKKLKDVNIIEKKIVSEIELWLSKNFKKELPFNEEEDIIFLEKKIDSDKVNLINTESSLKKSNDWISLTQKEDEIDVSKFPKEIENIKDKLRELKNKLLTYQGKCCPTCGHVEHQSDPEKEELCLEDININEELIEYKEEKIKKNNEIIYLNKKIDDELKNVSLLEQSISIKKDKIKLLQDKINLIKGSKDIVEHNKNVESASIDLTLKNNIIKENIIIINELCEKIKKFDENKDKIKNNIKIQDKINSNTDILKTYKLSVFNLDNNINKIYGEIKVLENNKENFEDKLKDIKNSEKLFKKYSIYLQAVHRDGIPSAIIRKKLPIINSKINSILTDVVDFKIELDILPNGNVVETFFFSEDKCDALPLSSASGSQRFIASIVITEALRYMSRLTKPSIRIIDEGFGTLDDELTIGVVNILNYLRNKYKNVLIITHRNEIKDFSDNIIDVVKVTDGLDQKVLENNPKAGVSKITIS